MRDVTDPHDQDDWLIEGSTDPVSVADQYDDWAETYDGDVDSWSYRSPTIVAGLVVEHAPQAEVVLDAGCGTGRTGRALHAAGFLGAIHGIDVSRQSLDVAGENGAYDSVAVANLQEPLTFDDDSFDVTICVGVMTYVPDVEACWREFCRVTRTGGLIVVTQRSDLWDARGCGVVVDRLVEDGSWEPILVTGPEPYLPGNPDFADEVKVHYLAARVPTPTANA